MIYTKPGRLAILLASVVIPVLLFLSLLPSHRLQAQLRYVIAIPVVMNNVSGPFPNVPTVDPLPIGTPAPTTTPEWLSYTNAYRALAHMKPITENLEFNKGAWLHSRYMALNDIQTHVEDPGLPFYTDEGELAGGMGVIYSRRTVSEELSSTEIAQSAIDGWMTAPFHQLLILTPILESGGYGHYVDHSGDIQLGATMDVGQGLVDNDPNTQFPIRFPDDGEVLPVTFYYGAENPEPLTSCPGYRGPVGAPIVLMTGRRKDDPVVTLSRIVDEEGQELEHCVLHSGSYSNPDRNAQSGGRGILSNNGAVVLMTRRAFRRGTTYTVTIEETLTGINHWSFRTLESGEKWP